MPNVAVYNANWTKRKGHKQYAAKKDQEHRMSQNFSSRCEEVPGSHCCRRFVAPKGREVWGPEFRSGDGGGGGGGQRQKKSGSSFFHLHPSPMHTCMHAVFPCGVFKRWMAREEKTLVDSSWLVVLLVPGSVWAPESARNQSKVTRLSPIPSFMGLSFRVRATELVLISTLQSTGWACTPSKQKASEQLARKS